MRPHGSEKSDRRVSVHCVAEADSGSCGGVCFAGLDDTDGVSYGTPLAISRKCRAETRKPWDWKESVFENCGFRPCVFNHLLEVSDTT